MTVTGPLIATSYRPIRNPGQHATLIHGQRVGGGRVGSDALALCGEFLRTYGISERAVVLPGEPITCKKCLVVAERYGLKEAA